MSKTVSIEKLKNSAIRDCTSYVLHKNFQSSLKHASCQIFDLIEHRLTKMLERTTDVQQKKELQNWLNEYLAGDIAIAMFKGNPVKLYVVKDTCKP